MLVTGLAYMAHLREVWLTCEKACHASFVALTPADFFSRTDTGGLGFSHSYHSFSSVYDLCTYVCGCDDRARYGPRHATRMRWK